MLVLSRKSQEKIQIGDDITITILRLKGKTVRVGIEAPTATPVLRGELAIEIKQEEARAAQGDQTPSRVGPEPRVGSAPSRSDKSPSQAWSSDQQPSVSHARVPRSRVGTVLPKMLGEAGPLRAMLDRGGVTSEC